MCFRRPPSRAARRPSGLFLLSVSSTRSPAPSSSRPIKSRTRWAKRARFKTIIVIMNTRSNHLFSIRRKRASSRTWRRTLRSSSWSQDRWCAATDWPSPPGGTTTCRAPLWLTDDTPTRRLAWEQTERMNAVSVESYLLFSYNYYVTSWRLHVNSHFRSSSLYLRLQWRAGCHNQINTRV